MTHYNRNAYFIRSAPVLPPQQNTYSISIPSIALGLVWAGAAAWVVGWVVRAVARGVVW